MKTVLIHARPIDPRTGLRVDVFAADAASADGFAVDGIAWSPAVKVRPTRTIELFSPDMDGKVSAAQARLTLRLGALTGHPRAAAYHWGGAPISIWATDQLKRTDQNRLIAGTVAKSTLDLDASTLAITAEVDTSILKRPLLTREFSGGSGIGGGPTRRGTLYPAGYGVNVGIPPVWFDDVDNIGMIEGYGNLVSVQRVLEGASDLGPSVGNYPSYAALKAAIAAGAVPRGRWATCIAEGLIGLGAPPAYAIGVDATFGAGLPGSWALRMLRTHAGIADSLIEVSAFDALSAAVPRPVHFWTSSQREVLSLLEALAASCNATPLVLFDGRVSMTRAVLSAPVATLNRNGSVTPRVLNWKSVEAEPPYWQLKARTARPAGVLTYDQVNFGDNLTDQGLFELATTYRLGDYVWLSNGSQWLYINDLPAAGHAPPPPPAISDAWWFQMQPPTKQGDIAYDDGQTGEDLKPDEAGAQMSRNLNLSDSALTFVVTAGTPPAGQLPYIVRGTVTVANADDTLASSWSISPSSGITASIDNGPSSPTRGQITITNVAGDGKIDVFAMSGNVALVRTISITTIGELAVLSSVATEVIEAQAVTKTVSATTVAPFDGVGAPVSTFVTVVTYTLIVPVDALALFFINGAQTYTTAADFGFDVQIDGVSLTGLAGGSGYPQVGLSSQRGIALSAGSYTIDLRWRGSAGVRLEPGASVIIFQAKR